MPPSNVPSESPPASQLADLCARVTDILTVFDDPHYAHLDVPDWVPRASPLAHHARVTVRGLVRAMCEAATDLGLADGERYVLETVCVCAHSLDTQGEAKTEALARRLQHFASAWVAFLLWPFYGRMEDKICARGHASPCTGLSHARKAMAFGDFDPDECIPMSSYPLRDQVLGRDGHRCVVSSVWDIRSRTARAPPDARQAHVDAVRIFKHPLVVYKDVYDNDKAKRESVMLSLEVLRRYCELDDRYINIKPPGSAGVMYDPANLLSLCCNIHTKFDAFGFCFVPTRSANTYKLKDHDPQWPANPPSIPYMTLPSTVTFQDLSTAADRAAGQRAVGLPSRELLRMHAALGSVLYTSGLASMFDRIEDTLAPERPDVRDLPIPDPDGVSFWRDVVSMDAGVDFSPGLDGFARLLGVSHGA